MQCLEFEWVDPSMPLSLADLSRMTDLSDQELAELVEYGVITPEPQTHQMQIFSADCVAPLRTAARLRRVYDLDLFSVVLLVEFQQRIDKLEAQLRVLNLGAYLA